MIKSIYEIIKKLICFTQIFDLIKFGEILDIFRKILEVKLI